MNPLTALIATLPVRRQSQTLTRKFDGLYLSLHINGDSCLILRHPPVRSVSGDRALWRLTAKMRKGTIKSIWVKQRNT